jgi:hypothetical protein
LGKDAKSHMIRGCEKAAQLMLLATKNPKSFNFYKALFVEILSLFVKLIRRF